MHNEKWKAPAWRKIDACLPLRFALEIRHRSFLAPEFFAFLRERQAAFVLADFGGKFPYTEELTADFVYVRLHGDTQLYVSGYGDSALERWAEQIRDWRRSRDVYVYFDNGAKVHARFDAQNLARSLV